MILSIIHSLILAQSMNLNVEPLVCMDEALYCRADKRRAFELNCSGAGITCTQTGGRMTLTVTGGAAGKVAEAYMADASITAQYLPITCSAGDFITCNGTSCSCGTPSGGPGGKVAEAYMADASITAQVAQNAYATDASYRAFFAGTSDVAYSADASYYGFVSRVAYSTDASYSSIVLANDPTDCAANNYATSIASNGNLTCSQVSLTAGVSGTLPIASGGTNGTATPTAGAVPYGTGTAYAFSAAGAAGDCLKSGGTGSPTWGSCSSISAYSTVQDEGTPLTQRTTINFIGSSVSCVDNAGSTRTDCTVSGGGGSPGGVLGSVQFYSDAGSFGGMTNVGTDGTDLILVNRSTHATNPAAGTTVAYLFSHYGANSPAMLQFGDTSLGFDQSAAPYPFTRSDDMWWGCVLPAAHGQTTYTVTGRAAAGTATGAAAAVAWASTDARTRQVWIQHPAAATANTNAGYRSNIDYFWRGSAADQGGFMWWGAFALPLVTATTRVFVGLKDATAVITATSDPNVTLDTVYVGCNAADSNLSICSNDNVGTATCTTLGASFPCHTNNAAYDVAFWAPANGSSIGYWIRHLTTGTEATGSLTTDLPRNTVQLNWDFTANTGGTASAVNIHIGGTCWLANP